MKIKSIETVSVDAGHRGIWIFILVHTDSQHTGLGEVSQSGNDRLLISAIEHFNTSLIGEDPLNINSLWKRVTRTDGGRITQTAASGIEQALWDIAGQHAGMPIHALFGGKIRDTIRLYANINRHVTDRSPDGFAVAAKAAVAEGFTAIKLAPFDELRESDHIRTGPNAAWVKGVDRVKAVRETIGNEIDLMVDCHGRMEPSEAIKVGRVLSDMNLMWYEEPVSKDYPDQLLWVTRAINTPTASAESVFGMEGFAPFLKERVVDVLMPDVKHCGGIGELRNIAHAARIHDLLVAPHNPSGPVANIASCHACAILPNFLILEYAWGEVSWRGELTEPAEEIINGSLQVPDRPGLGYSLNMETVEAHRI